MKLGEDARTPQCACLNCGALLDAAINVHADNEKGALPEPGGITVCYTCGHVMAFNDDLTFRELTDREIVGIGGNKKLLAIQEALGRVKIDGMDSDDSAEQP
jgi:hypothetical protein